MPIEDPIVVRLLAEGGCIQIHGHKEPNGTWRFIGYAGTMDIEEDGNDSVRVGGVPWCSALSQALPDDLWIRFIPMHVHPELRGWFRDHYEAALAKMSPARRERHHEYRHWKWQEMFDSTPPDRWSVEETF